MREAWRWSEPDDPVSLEDIRQTGASDVDMITIIRGPLPEEVARRTATRWWMI
jgi:D-mannonate dehydratase